MPATTIKPAAPAAVLPASAQTISRRRLLTAAGSAALLTAGAALTPKPVRAAAVGSKTLRIAALPAIDALILYAAEADGIFKSEGLNIEILPFKSSVEMTAAIRAEKIIGQYANILGTIAQRANGIGLSLAATTWHTSPAQRAFGFAVSPKFADQITSIEVLKGLTGVSSTRSRGTIIDWMIYRMKNAVNLPEKTLDQIEVAQIPIRLQMLLTGKMQTALFYEPLLTLIESKGGRVIWDDRQLNELRSQRPISRLTSCCPSGPHWPKLPRRLIRTRRNTFPSFQKRVLCRRLLQTPINFPNSLGSQRRTDCRRSQRMRSFRRRLTGWLKSASLIRHPTSQEPSVGYKK